jgi:hypothetical protein
MTRKTALNNKIRFIAVAVAAMAVALTGLAGTASASGKAPTKVLIQAESGGFFGYVKSPKLQCKSERNIAIFKQLGSRQQPASDERVDMTISGGAEEGYEWNLGNPGLHSGRYYARALPTPFCKAANSVTLRAMP